MSNNSFTNKAEIELLISEMGMSPLYAKEFSDLMDFVGKIIITDATLVNEYCSIYQKRIANLSDQITELCMENHSISDVQDIRQDVLFSIDGYLDYAKKTSNKELLRIEYESATKRIKACEKILYKYKIQLESNLKSFVDFRGSVNKCVYWISMYILGGKIKLMQVDDLLIAYRSGDHSRIKTPEAAMTVINSKNTFEKKLSNLSTSKTIGSQLLASIEVEISNILKNIELISSLLNNTIPAFEQERSRIS